MLTIHTNREQTEIQKRRGSLDAAQSTHCIDNLLDGSDVSSCTHFYLVLSVVLVDVMESFAHHTLESLVNFLVGPIVALSVLNLFKVAYRNASSVSKHVWAHEDSLLMKDLVCLRGRRTVSQFHKKLCLHLVSVARAELSFNCEFVVQGK